MHAMGAGMHMQPCMQAAAKIQIVQVHVPSCIQSAVYSHVKLYTEVCMAAVQMSIAIKI